MRISFGLPKGLRASCLALLLAACPIVLFAAPAAPVEIPLEQPDGTPFIAISRGDEYGSWLETESGHSIVQLGDTWFYAEKNPQGRLVPGPHAVGSLSEEELAELPRHVAPDKRAPERRTLRKISRPQPSDARRIEAASISHTQNVLVILVDYTDQAFLYSDDSFQTLSFAPTDSVKEFFQENSYGGFTLAPAAESYGTANDGIVHVSRPVMHPNMGQTISVARTEAIEVVTLADGFVDFSSFDTDADGTVSAAELSIVIILAGYENAFGGNTNSPVPRVWGHASSFSSTTLDGKSLSPYAMFGEIHGSVAFPEFDHQATIGIMAHELGHLMLGLPDLYDTDGSSAGIGDWGLMGGGSWNFTGMHSGDSPAHLSAWSKVATQFTAATEINGNQPGVSFSDASASEDAKKLWIDNYLVSEYFLLENRQQSGFDAGLPGNGLLIWHIDESRTGNSDETHKLVDLEAADGNMDLDIRTNPGDASDPFYGGNNATFDDLSTPDSRANSGASTDISVSAISASGAVMTADLSVPEPSGDHVRYDENGNTTAYGAGSTTVWLGVNLLNDTGLDQLDGVDVFINDLAGGTVDVSYFDSLAGGNPTGLIHAETDIAVSRGWNRILFAAPQDFPASAERGIVVKVTNDSSNFPIVLDNLGTSSGRSYFSTTGNVPYSAVPLCSENEGFCGDINLVALFGAAVDSPPEATAITPDTAGPTNADSVDFTVDFSEEVVNFNDSNDVVVTHSGTAHTGVSISGSGASYTVSVTGISGDGSFTLAASTASDIEDSVGQALAASVTSASVAIDNLAPGIQIGSPSQASTNTGPVSYTVSYTGADAVTLAGGDISLNTTGDATGNVDVTGGGTTSRTVTISSITGTGSIGISVAAATASDTAGNSAPAAGPSTVFLVDNTLPAATEITPSTAGPTNATSVSFDITFSESVVNFDDATDLIVAHTGTAHGGVNVTGAGLSYSAEVTGISGTGSFTVAVDIGSDVVDTNGNPLSGSVVSPAVTIDNTPPTLMISAPSTGSTTSGPVSYTVDYSDADAVTLAPGDISLNTSGTADAATVEVTGSGTDDRTVTLSDISGAGTIGISIAADTASDTAGNLAGSAGPSGTFVVELPGLIYADDFEATDP